MKTQQRLAIFLVGMLIVRWLYIAINHRALDIEEAQYWIWSQDLAWGYHSKPPLIAAVLRLVTVLFGKNALAIRGFSPVAYTVTAIFAYGVARRLWNEKIALWSAVSLIFLPGVVYSATVISTDVLLTLFWSMALYAWVRILQTPKWYWWTLLGTALGFGLLSKYTMLAFLLSIGFYSLRQSNVRAFFKTFGPYQALLIALLILTPHLIWSVQHHFAAVQHVIEHNANWQGLHWHGAVSLLNFWLSQCGVFGPVSLGLLITLIIKKYPTKNFNTELLWVFIWPLFLLISVEALLSRAYPNWVAPIYFSATILVVAFLIERQQWLWLKIWLISNISLSICFFIFELLAANFYFPFFTIKSYAEHKAFNWQQVSIKIQRDLQPYQKRCLIVDDRTIWAESVFYTIFPANQTYLWSAQPGDLSWYHGASYQDQKTCQHWFFMTLMPWIDSTVDSTFHLELLKKYSLVEGFYTYKKSNLTLYAITKKANP